MKIFMVKYTEDTGNTYHTVIVNAENFTDAYLQVYLGLPLNDSTAITDLFEII